MFVSLLWSLFEQKISEMASVASAGAVGGSSANKELERGGIPCMSGLLDSTLVLELMRGGTY